MTQAYLLFWDQLSKDIRSLKNIPENSTVIMVECIKCCGYVKHHKKKLVFLLAAMRHFYKQLAKQKLNIKYFALDNAAGINSIPEALENVIKTHKFDELIVTEPSEYYQLQTLRACAKKLKFKLTLLEDDRFICSKTEFKAWLKPKTNNSQILMENFYHQMRKKTNLLMDNAKPIGGKWNFDKENRKAIPDSTAIPHVDGFKPDKITKDVIKLVDDIFSDNFGDIEPFWYGVTSVQANQALNKFIEQILPEFGDYQDAMLTDEAFLFHSVLSQYINVGLLNPLYVCQRVELEYFEGRISLACAEGFIRQIIGWREYVRGIYWAYMPKYLKINEMEYSNNLPDLYWSGQTKMQCLSHTVKQTRIHAYSHHIQRLMITGNFATLIGVKPELIHEWYLIVYIDAFEWVELPNTVGMATFADGGIVGSKPYVSGGNYINKMSNFCKGCHYNVKEKTGDNACPFNYLYWNYLITHKDKLKANMRLKMPYATLSKMTPAKISQIKADSEAFLEKLANNQS